MHWRKSIWVIVLGFLWKKNCRVTFHSNESMKSMSNFRRSIYFSVLAQHKKLTWFLLVLYDCFSFNCSNRRYQNDNKANRTALWRVKCCFSSFYSERCSSNCSIVLFICFLLLIICSWILLDRLFDFGFTSSGEFGCRSINASFEVNALVLLD